MYSLKRAPDSSFSLNTSVLLRKLQAQPKGLILVAGGLPNAKGHVQDKLGVHQEWGLANRFPDAHAVFQTGYPSVFRQAFVEAADWS